MSAGQEFIGWAAVFFMLILCGVAASVIESDKKRNRRINLPPPRTDLIVRSDNNYGIVDHGRSRL